ncbi:MAG: hypothetical protein COA42_14350 [Alteromonadaceae bacterium]|nr:MAG: hypothetical protein COA42_14350 [Alteromonadaceae bacterium]
MFSINERRSWIDLLDQRARGAKSSNGYRYISGKDLSYESLHYSELLGSAIGVARAIEDAVNKGDRVLILLPSGLNYIKVFFGIMAAECVPVTAYQPRAIQQLERARSIIDDCSPSVIICDSVTRDMVLSSPAFSGYSGKVITQDEIFSPSDEISIDDFKLPDVSAQSIAFLQYTSGSTSDPKGVKISHKNLFHNCQLLVEGMGFNESSIVASWLPLHHDMGLIGKILCSLYADVPCYFMSPLYFIKKPGRWLEVISKYKCTISGAPNFAYDLCVARMSEGDVIKLDLSSWIVAWNGAEAIRQKTLQDFTEKFQVAGFCASSHHPCYGLAEATLFVSAQQVGAQPVSHQVSNKKLGKGLFYPSVDDGENVVDYVSVGSVKGGVSVKIVDPETHVECAEGSVGELWTCSDSVGSGYWENEEETEKTFRANLIGDSKRYLRTGDLAVQYGGALYITGRIKDVFIINGLNIYPADIEKTVDYTHQAILKSAVFGVTEGDESQVRVVCEVDKSSENGDGVDFDWLGQEISKSVYAGHELRAQEVVFVKRGVIPKTTSGKIQRSKAKLNYVNGDLIAVFSWRHSSENNRGKSKFAQSDTQEVLAEDPVDLENNIVTCIVSFIRRVLNITEGEVDIDSELSLYAISSLQVMELVDSIESTFNIVCSSAAFYRKNCTIRDLSRVFAGRSVEREIETLAPKGNILTDKYCQNTGSNHPYIKYINPEFGRKLAQLKLDKEFVRGEGIYLYDADGERYLDFLSQYGALPFGHNPPRIWETVEKFRSELRPNFTQPSFLKSAGNLAERLVHLAPDGIAYATFTNSGAEAVEAAIKLAQSSTGKHKILSVNNGFHGKTLGALSATGRQKYRKHFGVFKNFDHVDFNDSAALEDALKGGAYAAFIVEPVQGEAGIICAEPEYLHQVERLCRKYNTVFIVDEIQTGLGRTGHVFYSKFIGIKPDIVTVAKGLSGGLVPVGACLASKRVYNDAFANKHTSTFAANGLACEVGLTVLDLLTEDDSALLGHVKSIGSKLKRSLELLRQKYPQFIREVRGVGLMLGLHLQIDRYNFGSGILASVSEEDFLTSLLMSHLLNQENIRVAFTLNQGNVLRVQPPLSVEWEECELFLAALDRVFEILATTNIAKLCSHIVGIESASSVESLPYLESFFKPQKNDQTAEFGFLLHPLSEKTYVDFDRSLAAFNTAQLHHISAVFGDNFEAFVGGETQLVSDQDKVITGTFWVVPRTAKDFSLMPAEQSLGEVQEALDSAVERGAKVIGLGAHTSSVTQGGLQLSYPPDVVLTTGNTFTSLVGFQSVVTAMEARGQRLETCNVVILGATGAIGRAMSLLFAPFVESLTLVGNPSNHRSSMQRMEYLKKEISRNMAQVNKSFNLKNGKLWEQFSFADSEGREVDDRLNNTEYLNITTDLSSVIQQADVVVTATNSADSLFSYEDLRERAIICDISRPSNVNGYDRSSRPDIYYFDGGVVDLPFANKLGMHTDLQSNQCYACMAETMLITLENDPSLASLGANIEIETLVRYVDLASKHGFKVFLPLHEVNRESSEITA